jgi:hypothetical protein
MKREYYCPTMKVVKMRINTMLCLSGPQVSGTYSEGATILDKEDEDSFGW